MCLYYLWTIFPQLQSTLCHCRWLGLELFFLGKLYLSTNISHLKNNTSYFAVSLVIYRALRVSNEKNKNKNRQPNVIWFNLPCSKSVKIKIDQSFAHRIDTHFPKKNTPLTRYSTEVKLKWVKAECKTSRQS